MDGGVSWSSVCVWGAYFLNNLRAAGFLTFLRAHFHAHDFLRARESSGGSITARSGRRVATTHEHMCAIFTRPVAIASCEVAQIGFSRAKSGSPTTYWLFETMPRLQSNRGAE